MFHFLEAYVYGEVVVAVSAIEFLELVDIKNTVDRHDKEIVNILKLVLDMLKKNMIYLEAQQKDYEALFTPEETSRGKPK
jgi:hypothetical protein